MKKATYSYSFNELIPYINWIYFFHAWQIKIRHANIIRICSNLPQDMIENHCSSQQEKEEVLMALNLYREAVELINKLGSTYKAYGICRLCHAYSEGDDIILDNIRIPLLRQQENKEDKNGCHLCLSDFVAPKGSTQYNIVGAFATTIDYRMETLFPNDSYLRMLVQTIADRLAEACTECMHQHVRTYFWGYATYEQLSIRQLHNEEFQGIRPAVGYPSLPDLSINFLLDELLHFSDINIKLTEHGSMRPHASTSGLMFSHPQSRYFSINHIDNEQLNDYSERRGLTTDKIKPYLSPYLI